MWLRTLNQTSERSGEVSVTENSCFPMFWSLRPKPKPVLNPRFSQERSACETDRVGIYVRWTEMGFMLKIVSARSLWAHVAVCSNEQICWSPCRLCYWGHYTARALSPFTIFGNRLLALISSQLSQLPVVLYLAEMLRGRNIRLMAQLSVHSALCLDRSGRGNLGYQFM